MENENKIKRKTPPPKNNACAYHIYRTRYNCSYTVMAKLMKPLELHH